ncbi:hypothetical protein ACVWZ3_007555 [Bradyrhizobium sp. i1.3.6]|jgi:hypothetical protein
MPGQESATGNEAVAQDDMAMDDDVASDRRRREELGLIKAFLGIRDPSRRQRILELAEELADHAASETAGIAFASTDASLGDAPRDLPGQTE